MYDLNYNSIDYYTTNETSQEIRQFGFDGHAMFEIRILFHHAGDEHRRLYSVSNYTGNK